MGSVNALESTPDPVGRRAKKNILRQAVRENVRTIEDRPAPVRSERSTSQRSRWLVVLGVLIVAAGAAAGWAYLRPDLDPRVTGRSSVAPETARSSSSEASGRRNRISAVDAEGDRIGEAARTGSGRQIAAPTPLDGTVFPVGVRRIVLDPGHGGKDDGTSRENTELTEKELTLDIARRLRGLLEERSRAEVLMTREGDEFVVLKDRAAFANESEADLFVSIHLNWLEGRARRGVETFYLGPTEDPYLVKLTSRENRQSGYSLADVRRLLDGIYLDLREEQSKALAASVQETLHSSLNRARPGLRNRGIKPAPFLVLVATEMPAILAEVSCLSHRKEVELLQTDAYRQRIAEALYEGIDRYSRSLSESGVRGS